MLTATPSLICCESWLGFREWVPRGVWPGDEGRGGGEVVVGLLGPLLLPLALLAGGPRAQALFAEILPLLAGLLIDLEATKRPA